METRREGGRKRVEGRGETVRRAGASCEEEEEGGGDELESFDVWNVDGGSGGGEEGLEGGV